MKPTVLIVDDDEAITQQLFWTLCYDYEVVTANDLQTAARRAKIYEPDVAILDLHFPPTLDSPDVGLRILDYIKTHVPQSKVVVITSATDIESQKACYARGADEFFDKPFDIEKLLCTMRRLAPLRQLDFASKPVGRRRVVGRKKLFPFLKMENASPCLFASSCS